MQLGQLLAGTPPPAARDLEIAGLANDNRLVGPGTLFLSVPGFTRDGHEFAPDAIARGAVASRASSPMRR